LTFLTFLRNKLIAWEVFSFVHPDICSVAAYVSFFEKFELWQKMQ